MDNILKEMCIDIINDDINSERFGWLLLQSGVVLDGLEWEVANKLIYQSDDVKEAEKKLSKIMH